MRTSSPLSDDKFMAAGLVLAGVVGIFALFVWGMVSLLNRDAAAWCDEGTRGNEISLARIEAKSISDEFSALTVSLRHDGLDAHKDNVLNQYDRLQSQSALYRNIAWDTGRSNDLAIQELEHSLNQHRGELAANSKHLLRALANNNQQAASDTLDSLSTGETEMAKKLGQACSTLFEDAPT